MLPDMDTKLKAILKSLEDVILPAIDPDKKLAMDQANIVVANIRMMLDQHDRQIHYLLAELRDYSQFLQELLAISQEGGDRSASEARELLDDIAPFLTVNLPLPEVLVDTLRRLKSVVDNQVQVFLENADQQVSADAGKLVIKYAKLQLLRERAWVAKAGFELEPEKIPSLDALLVNR